LRINNLLQPDGEPCFQVWDQSDTYYQFGCTTDSLQYRYDSNGLHLYQWDLNEIVAPNDGTAPFKNIVVKYFQDCGSSTGNCPSASNASGTDAIRDAAIEQIQYGIGSQAGVVSTASGTVDFSYWAPNAPSGSQWAIPYTTSFNGTSYACDGNPPENTHNMRCDDPQPDSDEPGSAPPPTVMSTLTLLSVTSYVGNDSGTGSFPAYQYQFSYTDTPLIECVDPLSQVGETCAGDHVLDSVTPFVYKHGTANQLQPLLLKYTSAEDGYYDTTQTVPGGNHYTIDTSWMYLTDEYDSNTGVGEHLDYGTAYNNSHGTPYNPNTQDNRYDPLYCWLNPPGSQYDCSGSFAYPDDRAWTTQVVIDRKSFGVDSSAMSQAETTYAYVLKKTGANCPADSQNDTGCVGDNWWPYGDSDWQDYYHGQFQGFNFVNTVSPSGDLTQDNYFSTDGWGKPSSDPNDAFAGDLTEEDVYQGNSTSGLDYYVSRYYDSVSGVFLSADAIEGNLAGLNPYSYVGNNPETNNDPTGHAYIPPGGGGGGGSGGNGNGSGSGGGGAGYGGGGNGNGVGNPGSGGHEGGGCAWWNPSCDVQQIWHTVVNGAQTVGQDVETDVSNGIHFLQQQEQEIIEDGVKLAVKIIIAIVAAVIAFGFFLYGVLRGASLNGRTEKQNAQKIASNSQDKWQELKGEDRRKDVGGGYIEIFGPNKNVWYFSKIYVGETDSHVEAQIIAWAKGKISEYLKQYGSITHINLLLYTMKVPCPESCAPNLRDGVWQRELQQRAGGNAVVQINVWYSPSAPSIFKNVKEWP